MEGNLPQDQPGQRISDITLPSTAYSSASQFLAPSLPLQPYQVSLGNLPLQGFGHQIGPFGSSPDSSVVTISFVAWLTRSASG